MNSELSIELLSWAMNRALASHSASRMNVANASVKNFAPIKISFQQQIDALKKADRTGSDMQATLDSMQQSVEQMLENNTFRLDTELVQVDQEVLNMVKHSGYYKTLADAMSRKLGLMKIAMSNKG